MLSLGVSMIIVDATIVNVAVPSIIRDLKIDSTTAEWINTVYALVFAALLITLGRVGDLLGPPGDVPGRPRRVRGRLRARGRGAHGRAPDRRARAAGRRRGDDPALDAVDPQHQLPRPGPGDRVRDLGRHDRRHGGGRPAPRRLADHEPAWRWAFFINIPVASIAIFGTLRYIRESKDENAKAGLDPAGFLLITFGLGAFVFGLIEGRTYGWWTPTKPFTMLGWTWPLENISIIPFRHRVRPRGAGPVLVVEGRRSRAGKFFLFDVELWRYPAFRYGNLAGTIVSLGEFGLLFALPLFLQAVVGYSAFETGLVFLSLAIGRVLRGPAWPPVPRTATGPRRAVTLGMSLEAVGIIATTLLISVDVTGLQLAIPLFVYGIGVGLRDGPAHDHRAVGHPGGAVRAGVRRQLHHAPGRLRAGHRDPRHRAVRRRLATACTRTCPRSPGCRRRPSTGSRRRWRQSAGQALVVFKEDPKYGRS